jgi:hypothetical protein
MMQIRSRKRLAGFIAGVIVSTPMWAIGTCGAYRRDHSQGIVLGLLGFVLIVGVSAYAAVTYIGQRYSE